MDKLKKNYVKRIETILSGRPLIPEQGINHVDDSDVWVDDMLYKGELGLDITEGRLYTQDTIEPVEFGREDCVLEGLEIQTSGSSLREINITSGKIRIKGRVYNYDSLTDIDDSIITIDTNNYKYPRVDSIYVTYDKGVYNSTTKLYGVDFTVVKGILTSQVLPSSVIPTNSLFLGFVLVYPNQTNQDVLRPLSVYKVLNKPNNITPTQFLKELKSRFFDWEINTLYFEGQILRFDNNLYSVAVTHISKDVEQDFADDKLISLGAVTNSNVSRFSHVGSHPTTGDWIDYYFSDWTANTRILDAFRDISEFVYSFAPPKPVNLEDTQLIYLGEPAQNVGVATLPYGSNLVSNVFGYGTEIELVTDDNFVPYDYGILKSYVYTPATSYTTSNFDLSIEPDALPNVVTLTDISNKYTLTLGRDDHYGNLQGFKGFYKSISANVQMIYDFDPSEESYEVILSHLTSNVSLSSEFYIESDREPIISDLSNISSNITSDTIKYESGLPVLTSGDLVYVTYDISDAVRYFYNHDMVSQVRTNFSSNVNVDLGSDYISPKPPYTLLASALDDGEILYIDNLPIEVKANVTTGVLNFTIDGYNSIGGVGSYSLPFANVMVDGVYEETGVRLFSNVGEFPSGNVNVDWGWVYTTEQSMANILVDGNEELQYFANSYFYPKVNYNEDNFPILFEGNVVTLPNYENESNIFRYATFNVGSIEDELFMTLKITGSSGLTYDLLDGEVVTANIKMFLKLVDGGEDQTGWLDINKPLDSDIPNPLEDGESALDVSWMVQNPIYRRVTFGTLPKTGDVYVRMGTNSKEVSFSNVVMVNINPDEDDGLWDYFELGDIIGESYVVFEILGSNGTIVSDFLNGTTMTSNFDIQLRVVNEDNLSLGMDWVDANESYPANGFIPYEYDDPALDLTYYDYGIPRPLVRKITFGPTTRTGNVQVRIRVNGCQQFTDVSMLYPTI